jgi:hypothetical protein
LYVCTCKIKKKILLFVLCSLQHPVRLHSN